MAFGIPVLDISLASSGGSSGNQYKAVVATSSAANGGYAVVGTRGAKVTGVLQENSTQATDHRIRVIGVTKVAAGDSSGAPTAITEGGLLQSNAQGQAVASTGNPGEHVFGYALDALGTTSTGIISAIVFPSWPRSSS